METRKIISLLTQPYADRTTRFDAADRLREQETELKERKAKMRELTRWVDEKQATIENRNAHIINLERQVKNLEESRADQVQAYKDQLMLCGGEIAEKNKLIEVLRDEKEKLEREAVKLKTRLRWKEAELDEENHNLKDENEQLRQRVKFLENELLTFNRATYVVATSAPQFILPTGSNDPKTEALEKIRRTANDALDT